MAEEVSTLTGERTLPKRLFSYTFAAAALLTVLGPLRLLGIWNTAYLNVVLVDFMFAYLIANAVMDSRTRLQRIELYLLILVQASVILGILNGNPPARILTDAVEPAGLIVAVALLRESKFSYSDALSSTRRVHLLLYAELVAGAIFVIVFVGLGGIRASITSITTAFVFFHAVYHRKIASIVLIAPLLVIGGKLGPLLSVAVVLGVRHLSSPRRLLHLTALVGGLLASSTLIDDKVALIRRAPVAGKIPLEAVAASDYSWFAIDQFLLGSRLAETVSALPWFSEPEDGFRMIRLVAGGGAGHSYIWESLNGRIINDSHHGAHFTPIGIVSIYGVVFMVAFTYYLYPMLRLSLRILAKSENPTDLLWSSVFVASIVNMATAYSVFASLLFVLSAGYQQRLLLEARGRPTSTHSATDAIATPLASGGSGS